MRLYTSIPFFGEDNCKIMDKGYWGMVKIYSYMLVCFNK